MSTSLFPDGSIRVWHNETYVGVPALCDLRDPMLVASPSGHHVAVTCERDKAVRVYDDALALVDEHRVENPISKLLLRFDRGGVRFYFPLTTCLLLSAVVSGLLALFSKLR